ncbi:MAG: winged helix-turn-helix transcriptional regulator [Rhodospirillales bacterium]
MANGKYDAQNQSHMVETTLDLLDAVAENESASQRGLADRIGVALGLTNAVLKRCVKKGLLKVRQAPARRYAYYLTPQGFAEKSRLTAEYLGYSLRFYRSAREEYSELFRYCHTRGWNRVALIGATDLAEIATLGTADHNITLVGVLDPERNDSVFCNFPVLRSLNEIPADQRPQAVILTDITDPQGSFDRLSGIMPAERILAPRMLRVLTGYGLTEKAPQKKGLDE